MDILDKQNFLKKRRVDAYSEIFTKTLDKYASLNKRYLKSNHEPLSNNEITKQS